VEGGVEGKLIVRAEGVEPRVLEPGEKLSFGRSGDGLQLRGRDGLDRHMPRVAGRFWFDGGWWVQNDENDPDADAPRPALTVVGAGRTPTQVVRPAQQGRLFGLGVVRFSSGGELHEVRFRVEGEELPAPPVVDPPSGEVTALPRLNPREVDYLVILATPELSAEVTASRPTFKYVASMWGVGPDTVEATVRNARRRLERQGFVKLGARSGLADISERFVRWALEVELVGAADWEWACGEPGGELRRAESGPRFRARRAR